MVMGKKNKNKSKSKKSYPKEIVFFEGSAPAANTRSRTKSRQAAKMDFEKLNATDGTDGLVGNLQQAKMDLGKLNATDGNDRQWRNVQQDIDGNEQHIPPPEGAQQTHAITGAMAAEAGAPTGVLVPITPNENIEHNNENIGHNMMALPPGINEQPDWWLNDEVFEDKVLQASGGMDAVGGGHRTQGDSENAKSPESGTPSFYEYSFHATCGDAVKAMASDNTVFTNSGQLMSSTRERSTSEVYNYMNQIELESKNNDLFMLDEITKIRDAERIMAQDIKGLKSSQDEVKQQQQNILDSNARILDAIRDNTASWQSQWTLNDQIHSSQAERDQTVLLLSQSLTNAQENMMATMQSTTQGVRSTMNDVTQQVKENMESMNRKMKENEILMKQEVEKMREEISVTWEAVNKNTNDIVGLRKEVAEVTLGMGELSKTMRERHEELVKTQTVQGEELMKQVQETKQEIEATACMKGDSSTPNYDFVRNRLNNAEYTEPDRTVSASSEVILVDPNGPAVMQTMTEQISVVKVNEDLKELWESARVKEIKDSNISSGPNVNFKCGDKILTDKYLHAQSVDSDSSVAQRGSAGQTHAQQDFGTDAKMGNSLALTPNASQVYVLQTDGLPLSSGMQQVGQGSSSNFKMPNGSQMQGATPTFEQKGQPQGSHMFGTGQAPVVPQVPVISQMPVAQGLMYGTVPVTQQVAPTGMMAASQTTQNTGVYQYAVGQTNMVPGYNTMGGGMAMPHQATHQAVGQGHMPHGGVDMGQGNARGGGIVPPQPAVQHIGGGHNIGQGNAQPFPVRHAPERPEVHDDEDIEEEEYEDDFRGRRRNRRGYWQQQREQFPRYDQNQQKLSVNWNPFEGKRNTWENFYHIFACEARFQQWTNDQKLQRLIGCLRGPVITFHRHLPLDIAMNYDETVNALAKRYGARTETKKNTNQIDLFNVKQEEQEDVDTFADRVMELAAASFETDTPAATIESWATTCFLRGLKDKNSAYMASQAKPATLREAVEHVNFAVANAKNIGLTKKVTINENPVIRQIVQEHGENEDNDELENVQVRATQPFVHDQNSRAAKCYTCGGMGHMSRECGNKLRRKPCDQQCFECGGTGHIRRECTNEIQKRERQQSPDFRGRQYSPNRYGGRGQYSPNRYGNRSPSHGYESRASPDRRTRDRGYEYRDPPRPFRLGQDQGYGRNEHQHDNRGRGPQSPGRYDRSPQRYDRSPQRYEYSHGRYEERSPGRSQQYRQDYRPPDGKYDDRRYQSGNTRSERGHNWSESPDRRRTYGESSPGYRQLPHSPLNE